MGRIRDAVRRMGVVGELLNFLWRERLWWMIPILIALILVALLVVLGSNPRSRRSSTSCSRGVIPEKSQDFFGDNSNC